MGLGNSLLNYEVIKMIIKELKEKIYLTESIVFDVNEELQHYIFNGTLAINESILDGEKSKVITTLEVVKNDIVVYSINLYNNWFYLDNETYINLLQYSTIIANVLEGYNVLHDSKDFDIEYYKKKTIDDFFTESKQLQLKIVSKSINEAMTSKRSQLRYQAHDNKCKELKTSLEKLINVINTKRDLYYIFKVDAYNYNVVNIKENTQKTYNYYEYKGISTSSWDLKIEYYNNFISYLQDIA